MVTGRDYFAGTREYFSRLIKMPRKRILKKIIVIVGVNVCLWQTATACTNGDTLSCKMYDGRDGVKVCVNSKWSGCQPTGGTGGTGGTDNSPVCPKDRAVVVLSGVGDQRERDRQRACFEKSVRQPNTIVQLGPEVNFDFSPVHDHRAGQNKDIELFTYPIVLGSCVTIESVAAPSPAVPCPETLSNLSTGTTSTTTSRTARRELTARSRSSVKRRPLDLPVAPPDDTQSKSARTSWTLGPLLSFGDHSKSDIPGSTAFLQIGCTEDNRVTGDVIRGFRIYGPTFGDQKDMDDYVGVRIEDCADSEIYNMDIGGWGDSAIEVRHNLLTIPPTTWPDKNWIRIHDNYLHHNLHTSNDHGSPHSAGYGVNTAHSAFSDIYHNVFDYNNHDVTADGSAGGYIALQNLILKGGGQHSTGHFGFYMHVFDVHGDQKNCTLSGDYTCGNAAGFNMEENTFQYKNSDDVGIRGKVRFPSFIQHNIFARSSHRTAIDMKDDTDITSNPNTYDTDTFGHYTVPCDFDGDGVDDLFFATGVTWWYSSGGQFPWTFMQANRNQADQLAFGDFDHDKRCDVLEELQNQPGSWYISRGGVSAFEPLAKDSFGHALNFIHPLSEVRFGNFNPAIHDHTGRFITGAFWRDSTGGWFVTPLNKVDWQHIGGSGFPLSDLKFGDFDGDGITDVLAVVAGRWAISSAGRGTWKQWNQSLGDAVHDLYVANMDASDPNDDLLKLEFSSRRDNSQSPIVTTNIKWWRSQNATTPWKLWKSYTFVCDSSADNVAIACGATYLGKFAAIPRVYAKPTDQKQEGAGTLAIDAFRQGHFFNPSESINGRPAEWVSDADHFRY